VTANLDVFQSEIPTFSTQSTHCGPSPVSLHYRQPRLSHQLAYGSHASHGHTQKSWKLSNGIINERQGASRVIYDV